MADSKKKMKKGEKTEEVKEETETKEENETETAGDDTDKGEKSKGEDTKSKKDETDGRSEQKKFFLEELNRLQTSLNEEASKIVKPPIKKHFPYVFNTLAPYYNTFTAKYLFELPDEVTHAYSSRDTALGLCDPWVNLRMDENNATKSESKAINRQQAIAAREEKRKEKPSQRNKAPGSTRLPQYPRVTMDTDELATKTLFYSDVPMLRDELHKKYSMNATDKIDQDYKRTTDDFYRMDLDKMNEVHPINRDNLTKSYFAYLQNTPGSKKAVKECVKKLSVPAN